MTPLGGPGLSPFHVFSQRLVAMPPGVLVLFVMWILLWKGLALWRAGRVNQPVWFVVLLLVNTAGLLEIAYLVFFARRPPAGESGRPVPGPEAQGAARPAAAAEPGTDAGGSAARGGDGDARS